MSNRSKEIAAAREADEQIAAAWAEYYEVANTLAVEAKILKSIKRYAVSEKEARIAAAEAKIDALHGRAHSLRAAAIDLNSKLYKGWQRFFLVKHIHNTTECSSFRPTTRIGWLPELSGQTEAEAVAEHGAILCTICFPTAPTEWTEGKKEEGVCAGSGKLYNADKPTGRERSYYSPTGTCSTCGKEVGLTARHSAKVRKHKA